MGGSQRGRCIARCSATGVPPWASSPAGPPGQICTRASSAFFLDSHHSVCTLPHSVLRGVIHSARGSTASGSGTVGDVPYPQAHKWKPPRFHGCRQRHKMPGSETKDGLRLTAAAGAKRQHRRGPVPQVPSSTEGHLHVPWLCSRRRAPASGKLSLGAGGGSKHAWLYSGRTKGLCISRLFT